MAGSKWNANGSSPGSSSRLLLVDSDPFEREMLRRFFLNAGYRVEIAPSEELAAQTMARKRPDAVLITHHEGREGLDLVEWIREEGPGPDMPVLLLCDSGEAELGVTAYSAGADMVVFRPVDLTLIARSMEAVLRRVQRSTWEESGGDRVISA